MKGSNVSWLVFVSAFLFAETITKYSLLQLH